MTDPAIRVSPGVMAGLPCIAGTRIPAKQIAGCWWRGAYPTVDSLGDTYDLTRAQVLVACWYMALSGGPRWRNRWGAWAASAGSEMWRGRSDLVPPPPQRQKKGAVP